MNYDRTMRQASMTANDYLEEVIASVCRLYGDENAHRDYPEVVAAMLRICAMDYNTMVRVKLSEELRNEFHGL